MPHQLLGDGPTDCLVWAEQQGLLLSVGEGWFVPAEVERAVRGDRVVLAVEDPPTRVDVAPAPPPVAAVLSLLAQSHDLLDALATTPPLLRPFSHTCSRVVILAACRREGQRGPSAVRSPIFSRLTGRFAAFKHPSVPDGHCNSGAMWRISFSPTGC